MKLHVQQSSLNWYALFAGHLHFSKKKPAFKVIKDILLKEKKTPNKKRTASGFCLTLSPEEEEELFDQVRTFYGVLYGEVADEEIIEIINRLLEQCDAGFKARRFSPSKASKGTKIFPLVQFDSPTV